MNIGELIKVHFDLEPKDHTVAWFARRLNCHRVNVYDIFRRNSIDTELLMRISLVLQHNFFDELAKEFDRIKKDRE